MPRRKTPPTPTCIHCNRYVIPIAGQPIAMPGKAASFRHAQPPRGCPKGDPLMEEDVA